MRGEEGIRPVLSRQGSMQVRSDLFTSVQIYRKCLASTYHGWGLQSLVSEEKTEEREGRGRKKRSECFCFFLLVEEDSEGARLSLWAQRLDGPLRPGLPALLLLLESNLYPPPLRHPPPRPESLPCCFSLTCNRLQEEFVFWRTRVLGRSPGKVRGNIAGLQNKQTCHRLDRNAATRARRRKGERTSGSTFPGPPLFSLLRFPLS